MYLFFLHLQALNRNSETVEHLLATGHEPPTNEGSEFFDDVIRMVDQPLIIPGKYSRGNTSLPNHREKHESEWNDN
jgi:hypothetical protein